MKIKVDLHVHSDTSDDGRHTISQLAGSAALKGISAIAVCDHNKCTPLPSSGDVLLIPGVELSTDMGHILGLFIERPVDIDNLRREGLPTAAAAIREIHSCGGIAVLAHPFERIVVDPEALLNLTCEGLDLIETANSRAPMKVHDANERAAALAAETGLGETGGSDAHSADDVGSCYTNVEIDAFTINDIKSALLSHRCEAVFVSECSWKRKALSQWAKARKAGTLQSTIKAFVYLAASPLRDIIRARQLNRKKGRKEVNNCKAAKFDEDAN